MLGQFIKSYLHTLLDVTVSVPSMISLNEGDGTVQVCVTLSTIEISERDFIIELATNDGTGIP